jgi:hypothetical protein
LIPDPSTKNIWVAKPTAGITNTMENGATPNPGTISVFIVVGTLVYGLIENTVSGTETPFCIDASNPNSGAAIQVQNGFNTSVQPQTLSATGATWQPTAALIGTRIIITHPGLAAISANIGVIDISNVGFPVWYQGGLTATGGITAAHISAGGTGYAGGGTGTTTNPTSLTGGTGTGAKGIVHFVAGVCTWVVITDPGSGYLAGDVLGVPAFFGGTGGQVTVDAIQTTGVTNIFPDAGTVPQWVAQFFQRAWYGVNPNNGTIPSVLYSDILHPYSVTNANQALTFGDNIPTTAAAGLGLSNQLGGVVQSLIVFKSVSYIIQITGDAALSTLATNHLNVPTGTLSARGVTETPQGLIFAAPDGLRLIDLNASVSDPIGAAGMGVTNPFTYGVIPYPSTLAMGCNRGVIRVSLQYAIPGNDSSIPPSPVQNEFWYDMARKSWSGPHATAYGQYSNYKDTWLVFRGDLSVHARTNLLTILAYPGTSSVYFGTGVTRTCELTTSVLQPTDVAMSQIEIVELQIMTNCPIQFNNSTIAVSIWDQDGNVVATTNFVTVGNSTTPTTTGMYPRRISFTTPVIVTRFAVDVSVTVSDGSLMEGFRIGAIYVRYRDLGYMQELPG